MKSAIIAAIARIARPYSYGEWLWSLRDVKCAKIATRATRIANLAGTGEDM